MSDIDKTTTKATAKTQTATAALKLITGLVVSNKMTKLLLLRWRLESIFYGKFVKHTTTYHVHDEKMIVEGDTVTITQCRPYQNKF